MGGLLCDCMGSERSTQAILAISRDASLQAPPRRKQSTNATEGAPRTQACDKHETETSMSRHLGPQQRIAP